MRVRPHYLFLSVLLIGCGGGGTDSGGTYTRECGLNAYTPNYAAAEDGWDGLKRRTASTVTYRIERGSATNTEVQAAIDAFRSWEDVVFPETGNRFEFVEVTGAADIVVRWDSIANLDGAAGITRATFDQDGYFVTTEMTLGRIQSGYPIAEAYNTAEHEMGHALGIFKHSPDTRDLMYFEGNAGPTPTPEKTERDVNTLLTSYCGALRDLRSRSPKGAGVVETITTNHKPGAGGCKIHVQGH